MALRRLERYALYNTWRDVYITAKDACYIEVRNDSKYYLRNWTLRQRTQHFLKLDSTNKYLVLKIITPVLLPLPR